MRGIVTLAALPEWHVALQCFGCRERFARPVIPSMYTHIHMLIALSGRWAKGARRGDDADTAGKRGSLFSKRPEALALSPRDPPSSARSRCTRATKRKTFLSRFVYFGKDTLCTGIRARNNCNLFQNTNIFFSVIIAGVSLASVFLKMLCT